MSAKSLATSLGTLAGSLVLAAGLVVLPSTGPAQAGPDGSVVSGAATFRAAPVDWSRCRDGDLQEEWRSRTVS